MRNNHEIHELAGINRWVRHFARAPHQRNAVHEADAELVSLPGGSGLLAVTIDTVAEEIVAGLYEEPSTMGWVTIMASLSDLAAVAADPLGVVVSVTLEPTRDDSFRDAIARGMAAACDACGTFILGGDTNTGPTPSLTACAIGTLPATRGPIRVGCRPGDVIFISGPVGMGSALALARFAGGQALPESSYRPVARLNLRHAIRECATACMDTSDGLLPTLDQLMRVNGCGFQITQEAASLLDSRALQLAEAAGIPPWCMLAGPHGEFELVITVPRGLSEEFSEEAQPFGWTSLPIGTVTEEPLITITADGRCRPVNTTLIRNLFDDVGGNVRRFVEGLPSALAPDKEA